MALITIHDLRIWRSSYRLILDPLVLLGAALLEGFWVRGFSGAERQPAG